MSQRRQFSLRAVFAITTKVAIGCAIWGYLPPDLRLALAAGAAIGLVSACVVPQRYWYWDPIKWSGERCVTRRRAWWTDYIGPGKRR